MLLKFNSFLRRCNFLVVSGHNLLMTTSCGKVVLAYQRVLLFPKTLVNSTNDLHSSQKAFSI